MKPLQIMIGFDHNEPAAFHVLAHSIMRRASRPVSITPLYLPQLQKLPNEAAYTRPRGPTESTEFSMTRFLTPWIAGFAGVSIFMDSDMLCLSDICELEDIALSQMDKDVLVVKHDYLPKTQAKFLDQVQTIYPRKNWSSLMVFNGHRMPVRHLTPTYINESKPAALHGFDWATSIGELPKEWNHLVGEYEPNPAAKLVHFTLGGPWFPEYRDCEFADHWRGEAALALYGSGSAAMIAQQN